MVTRVTQAATDNNNSQSIWVDGEQDGVNWDANPVKENEAIDNRIPKTAAYVETATFSDEVGTTNIQQALANSRSLADLLPIARRATAHLSFWGSRYVSLTGYGDTLELDALASKIIELVKQYPQLDEQERACGQEIASLIDRNIYGSIDIQINNSNCFTWLFMKARDLCHSILLIFQKGITDACFVQSIRWQWTVCCININTKTAPSFLSQF